MPALSISKKKTQPSISPAPGEAYLETVTLNAEDSQAAARKAKALSVLGQQHDLETLLKLAYISEHDPKSRKLALSFMPNHNTQNYLT